MAHGLVLRLQESLKVMENQKTGLNQEKKDPSSSQMGGMNNEDVNIIQAWIAAHDHPKNSKMEFTELLRRTLLYMFSNDYAHCPREHAQDLLFALRNYCKKFPAHNAKEIQYSVQKVSEDPWRNLFFQFEDLFTGAISYEDEKVQEYFAAEPEEVVTARIHSLAIRQNVHGAMVLAKQSFLFHSRVEKTIAAASQAGSERKGPCGGLASIDWFVRMLCKIKSIREVVNEVNMLKCHEGVEIILRLKKYQKSRNISHTLTQIFLVQDLMKPSEYCCTKILFSLFCGMHKELNSSVSEIATSTRSILASFAPTSAHFFAFTDALWEQFETKCLALCVEMYVRGLTADINHLEMKKQQNLHVDVKYLETHIANAFEKLSGLFITFHDNAARECLFSAFSLRPTTERYCLLQNITLRQKKKLLEEAAASASLFTPVQEPKDDFLHPLLNKGIRNIPYSLIKDLVCVLESVRQFGFQYNVFEWMSGLPLLDNYLKAHPHLGSESSSSSSFNKTSGEDKTKLNKPSLQVNTVKQKMVTSALKIKRKKNSETATVDGMKAGRSGEKKVKKPRVNKKKDTVVPLAASNNVVGDLIENVVRKTLADQVKQENFKNIKMYSEPQTSSNIGPVEMQSRPAYPQPLIQYGKYDVLMKKRLSNPKPTMLFDSNVSQTSMAKLPGDSFAVRPPIKRTNSIHQESAKKPRYTIPKVVKMVVQKPTESNPSERAAMNLSGFRSNNDIQKFFLESSNVIKGLQVPKHAPPAHSSL